MARPIREMFIKGTVTTRIKIKYGHGPNQEMSIKGTVTTRINKIWPDPGNVHQGRELSQPG
jgi:hypothetical protein